MSLDDFKEKYLTMMAVRDQARKELVAIENLENIFLNCDEQEIDQILLLQLVLKEQRHLVQGLCAPSDFAILIEYMDKLATKADIESFLTEL